MLGRRNRIDRLERRWLVDLQRRRQEWDDDLRRCDEQ
jgi:hypothetical protein